MISLKIHLQTIMFCGAVQEEDVEQPIAVKRAYMQEARIWYDTCAWHSCPLSLCVY